MLVGHVGIGLANPTGTKRNAMSANQLFGGLRNPLSPFAIAGGSGPALFQPPDLTDKVLSALAAQTRMRNQIGRTRASTFFGADMLASVPMTQRSLFGAR